MVLQASAEAEVDFGEFHAAIAGVLLKVSIDHRPAGRDRRGVCRRSARHGSLPAEPFDPAPNDASAVVAGHLAQLRIPAVAERFRLGRWPSVRAREIDDGDGVWCGSETRATVDRQNLA
jgi:hypothetical protein